jgi:hypothetical protein
MYFLLNPRLDWKNRRQGDEKVSKCAQKIGKKPFQAGNTGLRGN